MILCWEVVHCQVTLRLTDCVIIRFMIDQQSIVLQHILTLVQTPFVRITTDGPPITRIRVPAVDDEKASTSPDHNGLIPFVPTEETFRMLLASTKCHEFLVTALDTDVNVVAMAIEDQQVLFLQEPGLTTYLKFFGPPEILNLSLHTPTTGRWKACSQKEFGLQIGCSQLFDFSVEYLRYRRRTGFKLTRTPTGEQLYRLASRWNNTYAVTHTNTTHCTNNYTLVQ